jgi:hypothetical protein
MRYGAYYRSRKKEIVWIRTKQPIEPGFYHRHILHDQAPDVCIEESVPGLIMKTYSWIRDAEDAFQEQVSRPDVSTQDQHSHADRMTEELVQRLDPNDDSVWVDEPHWVKHLKPA